MSRLLSVCIALLTLCMRLHAEPSHSIEAPGSQVLPYTLDGQVKVFQLTAESVEKTIYNEKIDRLREFVKKHNRYTGPEMKLPVKMQKINGWGYNNDIPGPMNLSFGFLA